MDAQGSPSAKHSGTIPLCTSWAVSGCLPTGGSGRCLGNERIPLHRAVLESRVSRGGAGGIASRANRRTHGPLAGCKPEECLRNWGSLGSSRKEKPALECCPLLCVIRGQ